jgi:hypothetical protein
VITRLKTLQLNRNQFSTPDELITFLKNNETLRNEIETLSKVFFHKSVSGCSNCYFDAYMQLISLKINIAMEKLKCVFLLLAGALLHDVINFDNDLLMSNANITDDLSLYHLKTNPNCRQYFQTLPENVDELIEAYQLPGEEVLSETDQAALDLEIQNQVNAEENLVSQIHVLLKNETTITRIKEMFKETEKVGSKNLTQRFLTELIDRAKTLKEVIPFVPVVTEETKTETSPTLEVPEVPAIPEV